MTKTSIMLKGYFKIFFEISLFYNLKNTELQMQNTLYNGTDFIPFTIPKFLAEIRIA